MQQSTRLNEWHNLWDGLWERDPLDNRLQFTGALLLSFLTGILATRLVFQLVFGSF
jgi:hypothetical protein